MVISGGALHHVHKRKRVHQKFEKYPSKDKWKRFIDKLIYIVAILGPLISITQAYKIWHYQSATGVSLITWSTYVLGGFAWTIYGIVHNEKPIVLNGILWIAVGLLVVIGGLMYS